MLGRKRKNDVGDGVIERDEKAKKGFQELHLLR